MDILSQIDRNLHLEVARKQSQLWAALFDALTEGWTRSLRGDWQVQLDIRFEEVMEDLRCGRD